MTSTIESPHLKPSNHISEVRSLTGLRGIAALYVVLFHFYQPLYMTTPARTFIAHGYLAVDLFFILSGFVMALNYSGMFAQGATLTKFRIFLSRRFARIYPLYLFTLLLTVILLHDNSRWRSAEFWSNVFLVQEWGHWFSLNEPSWSISVEWLAYLFFPFLAPLVLFRRKQFALLISILCIVCLFIPAALHLRDPVSVSPNVWPYPLSLVRCLCEFVLGVAAYRLVSTRFGQHLLRSSWYTDLIACALLLLLCFHSTDFVCVVLAPVFVLALTGESNLVTRLLGWSPVEWLGLLSFSIYLLHMLLYRHVLWPLDGYIHHFGYSHAHTYATLICILFLFPLSAATYYGIEVPARRRLRTVLESR